MVQDGPLIAERSPPPAEAQGSGIVSLETPAPVRTLPPRAGPSPEPSRASSGRLRERLPWAGAGGSRTQRWRRQERYKRGAMANGAPRRGGGAASPGVASRRAPGPPGTCDLGAGAFGRGRAAPSSTPAGGAREAAATPGLTPRAFGSRRSGSWSAAQPVRTGGRLRPGRAITPFLRGALAAPRHWNTVSDFRCNPLPLARSLQVSTTTAVSSSAKSSAARNPTAQTAATLRGCGCSQGFARPGRQALAAGHPGTRAGLERCRGHSCAQGRRGGRWGALPDSLGRMRSEGMAK